jgi:hypothetical protein
MFHRPAEDRHALRRMREIPIAIQSLSMNLPAYRIAARLGKAALKTHALQTLTRRPMTQPAARSVWSACDLSALSVRGADLEIGDTAGLETRATGIRCLERGVFNRMVLRLLPALVSTACRLVENCRLTTLRACSSTDLKPADGWRDA